MTLSESPRSVRTDRVRFALLCEERSGFDDELVMQKLHADIRLLRQLAYFDVSTELIDRILDICIKTGCADFVNEGHNAFRHSTTRSVRYDLDWDVKRGKFLL